MRCVGISKTVILTHRFLMLFKHCFNAVIIPFKR